MLGKQAEAMFEYILKQSKRYKLLAANVQIQGTQETLGELDYLIFDTITNNTLHIELACKFYLFDDGLGPTFESKWIGPNRKDTLQEKLDKVKKKQFPLLYTPESLETLKHVQIDFAAIKQQLYIKSFLFVPKDFRKEQLAKRYQDGVVGTYISFSEFSTEETSALYAIPDKKEWLLPPEQITNWVSFSEAKQTIEKLINTKRAPLVYKKQKNTLDLFFVIWW